MLLKLLCAVLLLSYFFYLNLVPVLQHYVQLGKRGMCKREEGGNKSVVSAFNGSLIGRKPFLFFWTWHITNMLSLGKTQSNWLSSFVCQPSDYSLCVCIDYLLLTAVQHFFMSFEKLFTMNLRKRDERKSVVHIQLMAWRDLMAFKVWSFYEDRFGDWRLPAIPYWQKCLKESEMNCLPAHLHDDSKVIKKPKKKTTCCLPCGIKKE